jgi:hypothetical protein
VVAEPRLVTAPPRGWTLVELPPDTTSQRSGGGDDTVLSKRAATAPSAAPTDPPLGGPLLLLLLRSLLLLPGQHRSGCVGLSGCETSAKCAACTDAGVYDLESL